MRAGNGKRIFVVSYFAYGCIYIARMNLTVASPFLQESGNVTPMQIGLMGSAFFWLYSVGQLLNGFLGDILQPKTMVMTGLLGTALSNIAIGLMPGPEAMIALWGVNGFSQSMLWGPLLSLAGQCFPPEKKKISASVLVSSVGTGSVLGVFAAAAAIGTGRLGNAFLLPGLLALAAFGAAAFFLPKAGQRMETGPRGRRKGVFGPWFLLMLAAAMLHGVLKDNINLWMADFFMDTYSVNLAEMSFYVFAIPVLSLAGRLIYPFLYVWLGKQEHRVSAAALLVTMLSLVPLCMPGIRPAAAAVCLSTAAAAVSVVNTSFLTMYPMRFEKNGCVSGIVGMMDFATYAGAGLSSWAYGCLLEQNGYPAMFFSWIVFAAAALMILSIVQKKENSNE